MENFNALIEDLYWKSLAEEGITKEDLDLIDLDIAYEPVTTSKGESPSSVIPLEDGKYIVESEYGKQIVSPEELKVMRFRYLEFDPCRIRQRETITNFFKNLEK